MENKVPFYVVYLPIIDKYLTRDFKHGIPEIGSYKNAIRFATGREAGICKKDMEFFYKDVKFQVLKFYTITYA